MSPSKSLYEYSIKDGASLILMGQASLVMKWRNQDILEGTSVQRKSFLGLKRQLDLPSWQISRRTEGSEHFECFRCNAFYFREKLLVHEGSSIVTTPRWPVAATRATSPSEFPMSSSKKIPSLSTAIFGESRLTAAQRWPQTRLITLRTFLSRMAIDWGSFWSTEAQQPPWDSSWMIHL